MKERGGKKDRQRESLVLKILEGKDIQERESQVGKDILLRLRYAELKRAAILGDNRGLIRLA